MKHSRLFTLISLLAFAIIFSIPSFFLINAVNNHNKSKQIVETGTTTTALPVNYGTNLTINDTPYYYIEYEFIVAGTTHTGKTSSKFVEYEYYDYFKDGKILIKYNENFESIEADYKLTSPLKSEIIMLSIFAIVDFGLWTVIIVFVVKVFKYGLLNFIGKPTDAIFVAIKQGATINNVPTYKVIYIWYNDIGQICEGESLKNYTISQAKAFEMCKTFKILTYKNLSRIISKPERSILLQVKQENPNPSDFIICDYCKSVENKHNSKCSTCGAPMNPHIDNT